MLYRDLEHEPKQLWQTRLTRCLAQFLQDCDDHHFVNAELEASSPMTALEEIQRRIAKYAANEHPSEPVPGVMLRAISEPTPARSFLYEPGFALVAQGKKRAVLGDRVLNYSTGQFLVVSINMPVVSQIVQATPEEPYLAISLALKPNLVAELLLDMDPPPTKANQPMGFAVSTAFPTLLDPVARLLDLFEHPKDIGVLSPMLEREIHWRLLNSDQGRIVRQIGMVDSSLSQVGRAMRWIQTHFAEKFRIEDVAKIAGMNPATFYRQFRAVTATSPLQYQKQVRLHEARVLLMTDRRDISSVAFSVGYDNPSQFSREYSRLFGASPGRDSNRFRSASMPQEV